MFHLGIVLMWFEIGKTFCPVVKNKEWLLRGCFTTGNEWFNMCTVWTLKIVCVNAFKSLIFKRIVLRYFENGLDKRRALIALLNLFIKYEDFITIKRFINSWYLHLIQDLNMHYWMSARVLCRLTLKVQFMKQPRVLG